MPALALPPANQEWFDASEIAEPAATRARQLRALNRALARAAALPYYRRTLAAADGAPRRVTSFEEYAGVIPRVCKADLVAATRTAGTGRAGIEALGSRPVSNIVMTSGTLGFNTFAYLTRHDLQGSSFRNGLRELWSLKVRPGMCVLTLSPAWHALALLDTRALTALGARVIMPWGTFAPRFVPNFLDAVREHRPEHLLLTAPVLRGMIEECDRRRLDSPAWFASVRYVGCAGESLSGPFRAHVIERLGLDGLFERGGSSDGMFGGGECFAHRGHHISAELQYVEVVDPETGRLLPPGERGSSVVTNLAGGRSVYVRFDTEDVAAVIPGPCPCGRTDPVLELYGRLADSVILPGRIVAPADIRAVLDTFPELMAQPFAVAKRGPAAISVTLGVVRDPAALARAEEALRDTLGIDITLAMDDSLVTGWKGQAMTAIPSSPPPPPLPQSCVLPASVLSPQSSHHG